MMYGTLSSTPAAAAASSTGGGTAQLHDNRRFYDDFTTIDWVRDAIDDSSRRKFIQSQPGLRGRILRTLDGIQGWVLIAIVAFSFAVLAYIINECETLLFDLKQGICAPSPFSRYSQCCETTTGHCDAWRSWSDILAPFIPTSDDENYSVRIDFLAYFIFTVGFAFLATSLTLRTKTTSFVPSATTTSSDPTNNNNIEDDSHKLETDPLLNHSTAAPARAPEPRVIYSAYGSGVPEVKTILSGFVIRRYLGTYTLFHKSVALVFSIASGMSLGKEGPFVHLAACVGNISCRLFPKYANNDLKRRQILSAASSAGVALAFGSPLGGVLFSLEEVSYYFLPHQLFRIFFCAMMSALFLKFLNPYKTGKIVLFEVSYDQDWHAWELVNFVFLGIAGGLYGALFCKFIMWWPKVFREGHNKFLKSRPCTEVVIIAIITACLCISNDYTRSSIAELLLDLASPCTNTNSNRVGVSSLCPNKPELIPSAIWPLCYALAVKILLTAITFGIKVPAGVYVPSMVIGALFGRITGMLLQYTASTTTLFDWLGATASLGVADIVPGTYAMAGAGAFMAGVTRMNVTLAVILFELTGSLDYVLPFSITILVANWVANAVEPKSLYELLIAKNDFPYLDNRLVVSFDSSLADLVTRVETANMLDLSKGPYVTVARLEGILSRLHMRGEIDGCVPLVKGSVLVGLISAPQLEFALDQIRSAFLQERERELEQVPEQEVEGDTEIEKEMLGALLCRVSVRDSDLNRYHHYYNGTSFSMPVDSTVPAHEPPITTTTTTTTSVAGDSEDDYEHGDDDGDDQMESFDFSHDTTRNSHGHTQTHEPYQTFNADPPLHRHRQHPQQTFNLQSYTDLTPHIDRAPLTLDVHSPLALVQMTFSKLGPRLVCVTKDGMFLGVLHKKKFIDFCLSKEN